MSELGDGVAMSAAERIQIEDILIFCGSGVIGAFAAHFSKLMEQVFQHTKEEQ